MKATDALEIMADELDANRLEVALMPAPSPAHAAHSVRVAIDRNPAWYRRLCARHAPGHGRHPAKGTRIRRAEVRRILARLTAGLPCAGYLARELAEIAAQMEAAPF